ncbi:MAG: serine--tRNA ligase, partial [Sedimenticolaceae bacterium]|nr:serine--tRNA ligase [Sedimenticolaceae bacterium]
MLDPKRLRNDLDAVIAGVARRGFTFDRDRFESLEAQRKELQVATQNLQNERNSKSKSIGKAKAAGEDIQPLLDAVANIGDELGTAQERLGELQQELQQMLLEIPNIPDDSVPDGNDEEDNREERRWGTPRDFDFEPVDHVDLGTARGLFDSETAARITGSRFTLLSGPLARLHRALTQFMLDTHVSEHGYTETYVPYLVNADSLYGTGQLPKFEEDLFKLEGEFPYYLIPTAEVPVTNILRDKIVDEDKMPRRYVAHTPCFRSEAGSYGKDTRGMIRQHQFEKVEMVMAVKPDESFNALEELTGHAEKILQKLDLPYRVVTLC